MSDIFISFDSQDLDRIKPLAIALETQGWSVFYDRTIPPGKTWREFIDKEITECRCMVVGWSNAAIESHWVLEEADDGLNRNILFPFLLDEVTPPRGFRAIQAANLTDWQGDQQSPGFLTLCQAIIELIGPGKPLQQDVVEEQVLETPKTKQDQSSDAEDTHVKNRAYHSEDVKTYNTQWSEDTKQSKQSNDQVTSTRQNRSRNNAQSKKKIIIGMVALIAVLSVFFMTLQLFMINPTAITQSQVKEPEMVVIPGKRFQMGSMNENDEQPTHAVTINRFALGRTEVTFDEYDVYVQKTSAPKPDVEWGRGKQPVIRVSWNQAKAYAKWLSKQTDKRYRLPTEAEWEYAARAGTTGDYYWGDSNIKDYAWFRDNSEGKTHLVGEKQPNAFGLYDMSGNVWEWVQDCWHDNYKKAPTDGSVWEQANSGDCPLRVVRGGSWFFNPYRLRSANRLWSDPDRRSLDIGFRLAQDLP